MESLTKEDLNKIKEEQARQDPANQKPPWEPTKIVKFEWKGKLFLATYELKDLKEISLDKINSELSMLNELKKELENKK